MDDLEWYELDPLASKVLVMCWLIASEDDGNLPSTKNLAFRLRMTEKQTNDCLNKLSHWLEQNDINAISERYQDDSLETETETETEKETKKKATSVACPHDVSPQVWQDWLQLRKTKKASVTETVVKGARAESAKLNWTLEQFLIEWCTRGSQGLKAEWVTEKQTATQKAAANMNLLTRGMSGPKPAPFWAKPDNNTLEVVNAEPKRLV